MIKILGYAIGTLLLTSCTFNVNIKPNHVVQIPTIKPEPYLRIKIKEPEVKEVILVDERDLKCMALNLYFEARNQKTDIAVAAVGYTVLNRVDDEQYPDDICAVIFQRKQYSWTCDGASDKPNLSHPVERKAWKRALMIAKKVITKTIINPIGKATMYHSKRVRPYWKSSFTHVVNIGDHIFYEKS